MIVVGIAVVVGLHAISHLTCDFARLLHPTDEEYEPMKWFFGKDSPDNYWWLIKGTKGWIGVVMVVLMVIAFLFYNVGLCPTNVYAKWYKNVYTLLSLCWYMLVNGWFVAPRSGNKSVQISKVCTFIYFPLKSTFTHKMGSTLSLHLPCSLWWWDCYLVFIINLLISMIFLVSCMA